jgi:branched-chain amino acid transport system permease protein
LAVAEGEIVAPIGPNGAGKTTPFQPRQRAAAAVGGIHPSRRPGDRRAAGPSHRPARAAHRGSSYALVEMSEQADVPPRRLTGGRRKLLELAMALALRPRVILLDELLAGLTPTEAARATVILRHIRHEGEVGRGSLACEVARPTL